MNVFVATHHRIRHLECQRNSRGLTSFQILDRTFLSSYLTFLCLSFGEGIVIRDKKVLTNIQVCQIRVACIACRISNCYFFARLYRTIDKKILYIQIGTFHLRRRRHRLIFAPRFYNRRTIVRGRFFLQGVVAIRINVDVSQTIQMRVAWNLYVGSERLFCSSCNPNGILNLSDQFTTCSILIDCRVESICNLCILDVARTDVLQLPSEGNLFIA